MPIRSLLIVPAFFLVGGALAQTTPVTKLPPGSDSWSRLPASSSSSADAREGVAQTHKDGENSHFKFKERREPRPDRNAALESSGKAPVMGGSQMGRDGRPGVSCVSTPMDPACR